MNIMNFTPDRIVIFRKQDDYWACLLQCVLSNIIEATLPTESNVGSCRIVMKSTNKADIDLLYDTLPELMIRVVECGRLNNPNNGEMICRIQLTGNGRVGYEGEGVPYYWNLSIDADILEWG